MLKDLLKGKPRDITPKSRACCMDGMGADVVIVENGLAAGKVEISAGTFAKIETMLLNGCVPNIVFFRSDVVSPGVQYRVVTKPFKIEYFEGSRVALSFTTASVNVNNTADVTAKVCSFDVLEIKSDDSSTFTKHKS